MLDSNNEIDLSGDATRSTWGGLAGFLGWLALGLLALVTAAHAVYITMEWANLNPAGGDIFAILAVVGVALVEIFAVLTAVMFATHRIRAKQKPVAMMIEGLWFVFAAMNMVSSFSMRHGEAPPSFVHYWIVFGLPIAGLVVGGLFYVMKRLDPPGQRAEDMAELGETFAHEQHNATVAVLNSEQMKAVLRQAAWLKWPSIIGRQLNLTNDQVAALERQAPQLLDLNRNGVPDVHETQPAARGNSSFDMEELLSRAMYRVMEEQRRSQPVASANGHDPNGHGGRGG